MWNVGAIIEGHDPASVALISRGRSTTYGELQRQVAGLRGGLAEIGIGRGDAVALACQNGRHFVVGYLALVGIGAVAVPLNPASPSAELQRELAVVGAVALIAEPSAMSSIEAIDRSQTPLLRTITDIPTLDELMQVGVA